MTIPLPRYTGALILTCPDCDSDLQHEGGDCYWCASCQAAVHFTQAVLYEDGDLDD